VHVIAKNARVLAGVLLLAPLLWGCAGPQTRSLTERWPSNLPPRVELAAVPFFAQEDYECGPAAMAMALSFAGARATPEELKPEIYLPARRGALQVEMLAAPRRRGLVSYPISPRLETLFTEIAAGNPVVVLQNLSLQWIPQWHYAVAVGYDLPRREILLRSGKQERLALSMSTFEHTWKRGNYWGVLVLAPGRLPRTAEARSYLNALVALEQVKQTRSAREGYKAALSRWPDNVVAWIGLGNTEYASGKLAEAEQAFRGAAEADAASVIAWNNLAEVLARQGRMDEALAAAERAVALGGPHQQTAQSTLEEIRGKRRDRQ
jgi:tetratricopeptide (TPR) repeat protein